MREFQERATYPDVLASVAAFMTGDKEVIAKTNFAQAILRYLPLSQAPSAESRALDLGCGAGQGALVLKRKGYRVTAVDKNDAAAALCGTENIQFIQADVTTWEPTVKYDLITMCDFLEHIKSVSLLLASLPNWLNLGGKIYIALPLCGGPEDPNPYHKSIWTKAKFQGELAQNWKVVTEYPCRRCDYWVLCEPAEVRNPPSFPGSFQHKD